MNSRMLRIVFFLITGAMLIAGVPFSGAAIKYVSPAGGAPYDGNDWASAYSNIQDAITACLGEVSTIYVQTGQYALTTPLVISGAVGLTFRGGYTGVGLDTTTNVPTTIYRQSGNIKLLSATGSSLKFDSLTFTNGFARDGVSTKGFTIQLSNCTSTFTNCVVRDNQSNAASDSGQYGTGIYAEKGSLDFQNCIFKNNRDGDQNAQYGGAIYATGVKFTGVNSQFIGNTLQGNKAHGGGIYLQSCTNAWIEGCSFSANIVYRLGAEGSGGGIFANASPNLVITNCTFENGNSDFHGSAITLTGSGQTTRISGCTIRNNFQLRSSVYDFGTEDIYINTTSKVLLDNTTLANGGRDGIYMDVAGNFALTNCLIAAQSGHGIRATAGNVSLVNCTVADVGGWGITNAGGTVTILDSILWNNALGSVPGNGLTMNNTYAQADYSAFGANNFNADPRFIGGYYLSVNGLTSQQTADSPCRDAGSVTAAVRGLESRTTRTDGTTDVDASAVDLGYHYTAPFAGDLANGVLYVDAVNGNDSHNGWDADGEALRTITAALGKAIDGSTINIAIGEYNTALGEVFPLTIQNNNISLVATNRDLTVINAGGVAVSRRALYSASRGRLWIQGLTLKNGYTSAAANANRLADGGGLYVRSCQTVITNCVLYNNRINTTTDAETRGMGMCVVQGMLTMTDSSVDNNQSAASHIRYGGGLYARDTRVNLINAVFSGNTISAGNTSKGGALFLYGGSAWIEGCTFATNGMSVNNAAHRGGAIAATNTSPLVITNCTFTGNGVRTGDGSALALEGSSLRASILNCQLVNNTPVGNGGNDVVITAGIVNFKDTVISGSAKRGVYQNGASSVLTLTNCLVANHPNSGIEVAAGTAVMQNVTVAVNGSWGMTNTAGSVTIRDSIFWGNAGGGVMTKTGPLTVNYTTSQEAQSGTSNQTDNPLFTSGYYLADGSPCIDAGSSPSADLGLDGRSTHISGAPDTGIVDLGYHYESTEMEGISNAVLYVSVTTGGDGNNGWSWDFPLKTLTAALNKAIDGSIIHVASGTYAGSSGETFPLVLADNNLTFRGTNRADTIINGSGVDRVFEATSKGVLQFECLTVTNGYAYRKPGAGFYLSGCQTTITNCTIIRNRLHSNAEYYGDKGGGIYALNGILTLVDSDILGQYNTDPFYKFGSGLYAENTLLTLRNVSFQRNTLASSNPSYGGGAYVNGGSADFRDCLFATNSTDKGGGLYADNVNSLIISNCTFVGNVATRSYTGSALYLSGGSATIDQCDFQRQSTNSTSATIYCDSSSYANIQYSTLASNAGIGFVQAGTGALNLTNCLVFAQSNDALRVTSGTASVSSSTLAHNGGWGITRSGGTATILNSIVWGNIAGGMSNITAVTYTDSQEVIAGTGNQSTDPKFENAAAGDFHLKSGSPCVNTGLLQGWMLTSLDLENRKRVIAGKVDLGCYESDGMMGAVFMIR